MGERDRDRSPAADYYRERDMSGTETETEALEADRSAGMGRTGMYPDVDVTNPDREMYGSAAHDLQMDTAGTGGGEQTGERGGRAMTPSTPGMDVSDRAAADTDTESNADHGGMTAQQRITIGDPLSAGQDPRSISQARDHGVVVASKERPTDADRDRRPDTAGTGSGDQVGGQDDEPLANEPTHIGDASVGERGRIGGKHGKDQE